MGERGLVCILSNIKFLHNFFLSMIKRNDMICIFLRKKEEENIKYKISFSFFFCWIKCFLFQVFCIMILHCDFFFSFFLLFDSIPAQADGRAKSTFPNVSSPGFF